MPPEHPIASDPQRTPAEISARRYVTAAVLLVMMLASMEMTVTSTAMPTIIGQLHGLEHYAWVASLYLLTSTVTMPMYGRLADALGRKRVILCAIVLFCLGSVLCSFAHTMPQLILYRGLQGLGAGGIIPLALTIIADTYTLKERAGIQGVFSAVWGAAALLGPALGAFLVLHFGWPSIFWVNLPFGVLGIAMILWKYHEHEKPHSTELDLIGGVALTLGCITLLALVSRLGPDGWSLPMTLALLAATAGLLYFFIWHELRVDHPLMSPRLLSRRDIGPSLAGNFFIGMAFLCLDTYVPLYIQGARGGGPDAAAWVVTPVIFTWSVSGLISAPMIVRWGFRFTTTFGTAMLALGFGGLLIGAYFNAPTWALTLILLVAGMGMGPCSMGYMLAAQDAVAWQQRGSVTSAVAFSRTIGGAIGVGVMGALFNLLIQPDLRRLQAQSITPASALDPTQHAHIPPAALAELQHAIARSLLWVFVGMLAFVFLQGSATLLMPRHKKPAHVPKVGETLEAIA